jgi:hypothetical protein
VLRSAIGAPGTPTAGLVVARILGLDLDHP